MKRKIFFILLLLITFFLLLPQLKIPWMIIDDGESARASIEISEHFSKNDFSWIFKFEAQNGLFRPTYWFFHYLNFLLFGTNALLHHFGHLLLFLGIAVLIFMLTEEISKDSFAAFLSGIFLLFFSPAAENFYRLGTGEPGLVFVILGTIYFLLKAIKKKSWFSLFFCLVFLVFAWFAKTTMIILIPVAVLLLFIFFLFPERRSSHVLGFCLLFLLTNLILAFGVKWIMSLYQIEGGYGSQYQFNLEAMGTRLVFYLKLITKTFGPIIYLVLASFLWRLFWKFKKREISWEEKWKLVMFGFFALLLVIQLPWPYLMGRYLPPALIGFSVVAGLEVSFLLKKGLNFFSQKKYFLFIILSLLPAILFLNFLWRNSLAIITMYSKVVPEENRRALIVSSLAEITPRNGRVFYNFSDGLVEFLYEMDLHFKIFQNRPDISTAYLFLDNGFHFKKGDIVVAGPYYSHRYPWVKVKEVIKNKKELININDQWEILEITNDEKVDPLKMNTTTINNLAPKEAFSLSGKEKQFEISIQKVPIVGGGISFFWKPPKNIASTQRKIPLIRQGKDGEPFPFKLFVWVEKEKLNFGVYDPWREKWQVLSTQQKFLPEENYQVIFTWGRGGMTLELGESYQFLAFYAGLNSSENLIIGSISSNDRDFEKNIGEINGLRIYSN